MRRMDSICIDIIQLYRKETGSKSFINVFDSVDTFPLADSTIRNIIDSKLSVSNVSVSDYKAVSYDKLVPYCYNAYISTKGYNQRKGLIIQDKTGVFKLSFSNNTCLYLVRYHEGQGKNEIIRTFAIGEKSTYYNFLKIEQKYRYNVAKTERASIGAFKILTDSHGNIIYSPIKSLPSSVVIHPLIDNINKDIDYYFNNVEIFTKYKQSGLRKFMLISEPGTGKSSYFYKLANDHKKTKSVVFVSSIQEAAVHITSCAKFKVPTIVILEDADSSLNESSTNSNILNFLDGIHTPTNPKGALIFMSTNFPERIEPRILTRPGRIDKIYNFDALSGHYAVACAKLYLNKHLNTAKHDDQLESIFSGLTGAQIKEIALSSFSYASSNQRTLDIDVLLEVKTMFSKSISEAYKYSEANSFNKLGSRVKIGFNYQ